MEQNDNLSRAPAPASTPTVPHWHAGYNQPGYLAEATPGVYASFQAARQALAEDMEHHVRSEQSWADEHDCDDIPCPTYGDGCHWQQAGSIGAERDDLLATEGTEWSGSAAGLAYWVTSCEEAPCVEELVARIALEFSEDESCALYALAVSGAVVPEAASEADEHRLAATAADQSDLELLCAYIAAVGERGAVRDWPKQ